MCRALALVLVVALTALTGTPSVAAPDRHKPGAGPWRVNRNDFVHYQLDVERFGRGERTNQRPDEPMDGAFGVFGYEIEAGERPRRDVYDEAWLILPYVLWMPGRLTRKGRTVVVDDAPREYGRHHATIRARGKLSSTAERKEGDTHEIDLTGTVLFETQPDARNVPKGGLKRGSGRLHWQATFDMADGLMRRATFSLSVDDAGYGTYPNGSYTRQERRITFDGTLVLHRKFGYRYAGFKRDVGKAIAQGMGGVRTKRDKQGVWAKRAHYGMGRSALGLLSLVKGGWDRDDTDLQKVVDWLIEQKPEGTYSVGLVLAAIEAWRAPDRELGLGEKQAAGEHGTRVLTQAERAFAEAMTAYLVENGRIGPNRARRARVPDTGRRRKRDAVTGMDEYIRWGYPGRHRGGGVEVLGDGGEDNWDNSNSQYAVLGLHSASLCDVSVPRHVWFKVLGHYLRHQRFDGPARPDFELKDAQEDTTRYETSGRYRTNTRSRGWGYGHLDGDEDREHTSAYGSMTCAGISSLAIADGALVRLGVKRNGKEERRRVLEAIRDGFAFLDEHWAAWCNPAQGTYYYFYYLYGLERAAMLTGVKWIGRHDWYWEGAIQLILCQGSKGLWRRDLIDTAFAVLFLKRGTKPVITPR